MLKIGGEIEKVLNERGLSVIWFSRQLMCSRANVYKIFSRYHIDTYLLYRISRILNFDFFHLYSAMLDCGETCADVDEAEKQDIDIKIEEK
nr:XRE family transcriptional regulator [Xylanibacter muris]